ncbi:MAG: Ribonuclease D [Gammaproteobacteria bacterium]|nr:Ribonuclease D [Gammaproteobacteria bacterium]
MLITTDDALRRRAAGWRGCPWLALDTEFVREDTYYAKLALMQICDGRTADCIDPLAVTGLEPLREVFDAPHVLKVLHSPDQDLEIIAHRWGICPKPLFDTQLAATLLGIADQPSYAALAAALLGVTVDKSLTRTPWLRRPLRAAELAYAQADVEHLARMYPVLEGRLRESGRLAWLQEDCARMVEPARYRPHPEGEWRRLKSLARLEARAQHIAARLAAWRETEAARRDRPRKWVLSDEAVYALATRGPRTKADLAALEVLSPEQLARDAAALLACVQEDLAADAPALVRDLRELPEVKARLQRLQAVLRDCAAAVGLPMTLIAPRADLEAIAREGDAAGVPALAGWRRAVAGEALLANL